MRRFAPLPTRGGGAIAFLDFGPADRVVDIVFLHATGFNALTYRSVLSPLGRDLRVLAVDQRGHGATTLPADPAGRRDWLDLRDDLTAVMASLGVADVILSGHSMGATVALLAAAQTPSLARRLVLFEPVILPSGPPLDQARRSPLVHGALRRRAVFASRDEALKAYLGRGAFKSWPRRMVADYVAGGFVDLPSGEVALACRPEWELAIYAFQAHDPWRALRASRVPIEIYRAERDSTFSFGEGEPALAANGGIAIHTVAGASHFLPMERPNIVRSALRAAADKP